MSGICIQRWYLCAFFLGLYLFASRINHIDDTDETYGYWEPLHYLLYGTGLQTWEYSPEFAIRTYGFIIPFYLTGKLLKVLGMDKVSIFYTIRAALGSLTAYSLSYFLEKVATELGLHTFMYAFLLCAVSPGIQFAATSFLPSAVAMNMFTISMANWLDGQYSLSICFGCLAVLCTGWPFCGVLFAPLGVYMLLHIATAEEDDTTTTTTNRDKIDVRTGVVGILQIIATGIVLVVGITCIVLLVDFYYYGKITSPTLNILLYNAIGGSGDELYGIEPLSYYIINLFLNMGISWLFIIAAPLIVVLHFLAVGREQHILKAAAGAAAGGGDGSDSVGKKNPAPPFSAHVNNAAPRSGAVLWWTQATMIASGALWLGILFSRPHKEERFLYPIYPLIATVAAFVAVKASEIVQEIACKLLHGRSIGSSSSNSSSISISDSSAVSSAHKQKEKEQLAWNNAQQKQNTRLSMARFVLFQCALVGITHLVSRGMASYKNYGGYLDLWIDASQLIAKDMSTLSDSKEPRATATNIYHEVVVCTGSEWYTFTSHFFLPEGAGLYYLEDGFGGVLPQHFARHEGTSADPLQPFNDMNREEKSRYVPLSKCDYVVVIIDRNEIRDRVELSDKYRHLQQTEQQEQSNWGLWGQLYKDSQNATQQYIGVTRSVLLAGSDRVNLLPECRREQREQQEQQDDNDKCKFEPISAHRVISPAFSTNKLARAFRIPAYSEPRVVFRDYVLFKKSEAIR